MPKIRVTDECMNAIRNAADGAFKPTGYQLPGGDWDGVELSDETYIAVLELCKDGLTVSDAIILGIARGQNRIN